MRVDIVVLNYNGRRLLAECLPSVLKAAAASRYDCQVAVIDNTSEDTSVLWLGEHFPQVRIFCQPNRGLCSFNEVLPGLKAPVVLLLNNDVRLDQDAVDPWVEPLLEGGGSAQTGCWMTAPRCYGRDGLYEGTKTAVRWRWGLVQAMTIFPGWEATADRPSETASAGAALAVDRQIFCQLGGFDPLYLPGRLEDLDLAFRAYLAGYHARYVPEAIVWHLGMGTFGPVFGRAGCQHLALRNTLLFQWKNLRTWGSLVRQVGGVLARLGADVARAPFSKPEDRWQFIRAFAAACTRLPQVWRSCRSQYAAGQGPTLLQESHGQEKTGQSLSWTALRRKREHDFFHRFHPQRFSGRDPEAREEKQFQESYRLSGSLSGTPEMLEKDDNMFIEQPSVPETTVFTPSR